MWQNTKGGDLTIEITEVTDYPMLIRPVLSPAVNCCISEDNCGVISVSDDSLPRNEAERHHLHSYL